MINIKENICKMIYFEIMCQLQSVFLIVNNNSYEHRGHAGDDGSGNTHFSIYVVSGLFENKSKVTRHRMVYDALKFKEFEDIHALSIKCLSATEYNLC